MSTHPWPPPSPKKGDTVLVHGKRYELVRLGKTTCTVRTFSAAPVDKLVPCRSVLPAPAR